MARIFIRPLAESDLIEIFRYYEEIDIVLADRFQSAAIQTFKNHLKMPLMGRALELPNLDLPDYRIWKIQEFGDFVVIYKQLENDGIDVIRVLHGRRDMPTLLEDDFEV